MADYNTVAEILTCGRLSLTDFPQSEIELAIGEAQDEITLLIPPLTADDPGYSYFSRRLPLIKRAHAYLSLSYVMRRASFDELAHGQGGLALSVPDLSRGTPIPDKAEIAKQYLDLSDSYRKQAEELISRARYRVPIVSRPSRLRLAHAHSHRRFHTN